MLNNSIISALQAHGIGAGKKRTGNAQPNDVRAGKIFSNKDGYDLVGNLPVRETSDITITPSDVDMTYPAGIYDGSITIKGDVNLTPANIVKGKSIFGIIGTFSSETTKPITADDVLSGKVGFVNGTKITGTMSNNGAVSHTLTNQGASYTIPKGYHNGNGVVNANITNLIAANIKAGVTVGGVLGTFTSDATATASQILSGYTAYSNGSKITGTMSNQGAWNGTITLTSSTSGTVTIPSGFHNGSGKVTATVSDADLIASNIRSGKNILGVTGTLIEATGNANTSDVLSGKTFSKAGSAGLTGTMPNNGSQTATLNITGSAKPTKSIPAGYTTGGTITAQLDASLASSIKSGVTIGGCVGTYTAFGSPFRIFSGLYSKKDSGGLTDTYVTSDGFVMISSSTVAFYNASGTLINQFSHSAGSRYHYDRFAREILITDWSYSDTDYNIYRYNHSGTLLGILGTTNSNALGRNPKYYMNIRRGGTLVALYNLNYTYLKYVSLGFTSTEDGQVFGFDEGFLVDFNGINNRGIYLIEPESKVILRVPAQLLFGL